MTTTTNFSTILCSTLILILVINDCTAAVLPSGSGHQKMLKAGFTKIGQWRNESNPTQPLLSYYVSQEYDWQNRGNYECNFYGGRLATILDKSQFDAVSSMMLDTPDLPSESHYWTAGLQDGPNESWLWITTRDTIPSEQLYWSSHHSHNARAALSYFFSPNGSGYSDDHQAYIYLRYICEVVEI